MRLDMYTYPKKILSIEQQICELENAAMILPEFSEGKKILSAFWYYRLHGYSYHLYDNKIKKYTINSGLEEDTLSIQDLGVVIDIDYLGEYIFVLSKALIEQSETLKLTLIDLSNFSIENFSINISTSGGITADCIYHVHFSTLKR